MSDIGTNEQIDLTGQVAIVTGGGRGIGRAMALALAKASAVVAVVARTEDQLAETVALIEQAGGRAIAIRTDVTDPQAVEQMAREVEQQLGPVDLLVNNAGAGDPGGPIWEVDPGQWWHVLDVNLRGPFLCSRAVLPSMIARRQGRIINTVSGAGLKAMTYMSAYVVSKTALVRLTENLAAETAEHGISIFAIHPGTVRTAMWETVLASPVLDRWKPGLRGIFERGRDIAPDRAANLVAFLASGKADALTGCFISVRDDVTEMVERAQEIREGELYTLRLRT
jgi:NAD(P)-dependent dehydrogenase (short-subunit alcohol dehydrogenase family)